MFKILALPADDFPAIPAMEDKIYHKLKCAELREMISKTIFSVSHDETRYHLNGIYFESSEKSENTYRMVATDGHRLAYIDRPIFDKQDEPFEKGVIIPRKAVVELRRLVEEDPQGTIDVCFDSTNIYAHRRNIYLSIRLINGDYPDYRSILQPNADRRIVVGRDSLLHSLKRVSLLANEKSRGVRLSINGPVMKISTNNPELGEAREEIDVDYSGEELEISFNARYVMDCLNAISTDEVTLEVSDSLSPGIIRGTGSDDYTCVVMPMRM